MSNFEGRRHVHRGDGDFPKRTQCQTLRASCSFDERRAQGSRRLLWSAWSLTPAFRNGVSSADTGSKAERKPFWGFAPNEPIFRFRSIRRVADAATDSGDRSVAILKRDAFQVGDPLRRAARILWRTPFDPSSNSRFAVRGASRRRLRSGLSAPATGNVRGLRQDRRGYRRGGGEPAPEALPVKSGSGRRLPKFGRR